MQLRGIGGNVVPGYHSNFWSYVSPRNGMVPRPLLSAWPALPIGILMEAICSTPADSDSLQHSASLCIIVGMTIHDI
jgi:hypothetical protein